MHTPTIQIRLPGAPHDWWSSMHQCIPPTPMQPTCRSSQASITGADGARGAAGCVPPTPAAIASITSDAYIPDDRRGAPGCQLHCGCHVLPVTMRLPPRACAQEVRKDAATRPARELPGLPPMQQDAAAVKSAVQAVQSAFVLGPMQATGAVFKRPAKGVHWLCISGSCLFHSAHGAHGEFTLRPLTSNLDGNTLPPVPVADGSREACVCMDGCRWTRRSTS
jgi:hypothetical protein